MPTIDVAVPCYNYARYLRDAVESILTQSHKDLRVLIIDNGSQDASGDVARQLAAEDARVGVKVFERNIGQHACYNAGIDWASGDYFFLLDADDLLTPGSLERGVAIMEENTDIVFSYSTELFMGLDGEHRPAPDTSPCEAAWSVISGEDFVRRRCGDPRNIVGAPTVLRRNSAQKRIGHYRASLPYTDDLEMWLRLATVGSVAKANVPQGIRRVHASQASEPYREVPARDFAERVAAFESFFTHEGAAMPQAHELLRLVKTTIGMEVFWYGLGRHREGDRANAVRCVTYGIKLYPLATVPRLFKWLASGEVSLQEAGAYLRALVPGARRARRPHDGWGSGAAQIRQPSRRTLRGRPVDQIAVCVIIAARNAQDTIAKAVRSALAQDHVQRGLRRGRLLSRSYRIGRLVGAGRQRTPAHPDGEAKSRPGRGAQPGARPLRRTVLLRARCGRLHAAWTDGSPDRKPGRRLGSDRRRHHHSAGRGAAQLRAPARRRCRRRACAGCGKLPAGQYFPPRAAARRTGLSEAP